MQIPATLQITSYFEAICTHDLNKVVYETGLFKRALSYKQYSGFLPYFADSFPNLCFVYFPHNK